MHQNIGVFKDRSSPEHTTCFIETSLDVFLQLSRPFLDNPDKYYTAFRCLLKSRDLGCSHVGLTAKAIRNLVVGANLKKHSEMITYL